MTALGCKSVVTAKHGEEALAILANGSIDLLVTDVRMPVMDGVGLVRRLAEIAKPTPSVIFLSGFGDVNKREMYSLGAEAFVSKPFDRKELLGIIERAIAERSTLWQTPAPTAPRQSMSIVLEKTGGVCCKEVFCLGRGGFSVCYEGAVSLGNIAFECYISSHQQMISGQGCVRWKSSTEQKLGVEFSFLDAKCRPWLLQEIGLLRPRCFIPAN